MVAWICVNILAPIVLPMLGLWLVAYWMPLNDDQKKKSKIVTTVQDGQLGWLAVAWSAAAVYEAFDIAEKAGHMPVWLGGLLLGEALVVLGGMFIAAGGAVTASDAPRKDRKYLVGSIIVTVMSALMFGAVHYAN